MGTLGKEKILVLLEFKDVRMPKDQKVYSKKQYSETQYLKKHSNIQVPRGHKKRLKCYFKTYLSL